MWEKAEHWRTDAFKLWCWGRLLRVPWTARRSNQSILKEINTEYSLEGLMLKLKLQYFGHVMVRTDLLEKTLMLGKTGVTEDEVVGLHHWLNRHEFDQLWEIVKGRKAWRATVHEVAKNLGRTEPLNNNNKEKNFPNDIYTLVQQEECWAIILWIKAGWKVKVKSLSRVWLFATPWTVARQVPLSIGFPRQEYWSGLPFPSPGDFPNPGLEPRGRDILISLKKNKSTECRWTKKRRGDAYVSLQTPELCVGTSMAERPSL